MASDLPNGWRITKLKDIADFIGGGTPSKQNASYYNGNILWATVRDMNFDVLEDTEHKISKSGLQNSSSKVVPKGNIVIATRVGVGKVCRNKFDTAINQDLRGICPNDKTDVQYLFYFLKSIATYLQSISTGATVKGIRVEQVAEVPVHLPPLSEQRRIVAKLDSLFVRIDRAIELAQQNIANAQQFMVSVLDEVFQNNNDWKNLKFGDVVVNLDGKRRPIKANQRTEGKYPYYGASGIIDYVADYIFDGESLLISEDGANLVMRTYPIAFIAEGRYWVNNHAHIVSAKPELTSNAYLELYFASKDISEYVTGSAQPKLSQKKLNEIPVPIPDLQVQINIIEYLTKVKGAHQQTIDKYRVWLTELQALKSSLLDAAFNGQLTN